MEIVLIVAIWTVMVKRGVEDIMHTARGGTPPRLAASKARRSSGAAGRYWSTLWDDTFDDMLSKHTARRARRQANPSTPRPRGAATQFFAGWLQDGRRAVGRKWEDGWTRADEKRREKATRPRPDQETVPGEVVPNAQDEDRPQDGDGPEPHVVPDEDGRTDLRFGDDPTDPTGTKQCPECHGTVLVDGEVCLSCRDRQEQRNQHWDDQEPERCPKCGTTMTTAPNIGDPMSYDGKGIYRCPSCDYKIRRSPETTDDFTQEGPTTMTATATEITGLDSAIKFCDDIEQICSSQVSYHDTQGQKATASATAYQSLVSYIDQGEAMIAAAGITGDTATQFATAKEQATAAAADMERAAAEQAAAQEKAASAAAAIAAAGKVLAGFKPGQEFYDSRPDAPDREFLTAGR
jgi:hypothetical protein